MPRAGRATGSMPWCRPLRPPREAAVLRTASSLRRRAAAGHRSLRNLRRTPRAANALLTRLSVRATHPQLDRRPYNIRTVAAIAVISFCSLSLSEAASAAPAKHKPKAVCIKKDKRPPLKNNQESAPAGADGSAGKPGANGINGANGAPGATGAKGNDGANGANGTNGVDGKPGAKGNDGSAG